MPHSQVLFLVSCVALATANLLLAGVLLGVWRSLRRPYLLRWALSWAALAVYHLGAVFGGLVGGGVSASHPLRLLVSFGGQAAGYLQTLLLLWGAWELGTGRELSRAWQRRWFLSVLLIAALATSISLAGDTDFRLLVRVGLRELVCGLVFLGTGVWLLRPRTGFGPQVLGGAMLLQGVQELFYATVLVLQVMGQAALSRLAYAGILEIVVHGAMGLGMLLWLFDAERSKALEASASLAHSEDQLRQAAKMEAIGRMAGGLAHDFNNLLTGLTGFSEMLLRNLGADHPARGDAQHIRRLVDRATVLTRQLLAFSRKQVMSPRLLNPNAVISDMGSLLRRLLGEQVQLNTELDATTGSVLVDQGQLEQVVVNLAVNARDAMPSGGTLTIGTRWAEPQDLRGLPLEGEAARGRWVVMFVRDTGLGMTAQTKARLFEPFFTTKGPGKGTGLGLPSVYGIVRQSGGHILVDSEPGCGALFRILLPHAPGEAPASERVAAPVARPEAHGHVLLVEDEASVRELASRVLRSAGFTVTEASHGEEALERAQTLARIDLLLTDVVMPRMSGPELASRMRPRWPALRVVFMSGYVEPEQQRAVGQAADGFLEKPFAPETLLRRVLEAMAQPVPGPAAGAAG